jgi:hypothetical protein
MTSCNWLRIPSPFYIRRDVTFSRRGYLCQGQIRTSGGRYRERWRCVIGAVGVGNLVAVAFPGSARNGTSESAI